MKIQSIQTYLFRKNTFKFALITFFLYFFSIITLFISSHYTLNNTLETNLNFIDSYTKLFFSSYKQYADELNKNQDIRNIITYINDNNNFKYVNKIHIPDKFKSNTKIYSLNWELYPDTKKRISFNNSSLDVRYDPKEELLIYSSAIYNFIETEIIGFAEIYIPVKDFITFLKDSIPAHMQCSISDSSGNIFFKYNDVLDLSKTSLSNYGLQFTTSIDLKYEYKLFVIFSIFLIPAIFMALIISYVHSKNMSNKILTPINTLIGTIKQNEIGNLSHIELYKSEFEEINILSQSYKNFLDTINDLMDKNHKSNLLEIESKLKSLQQNINPHFLFNTLELISSYAILEDAETTSILTQKLGSIFRYTLKEQDVITLEKEISHAIDYLYLQNIRFNEAVTYKIDVDKSLLSLKIPKLIFQPILENTFKYGFENMTINMNIVIKVTKTNDCIFIIVYDNGFGIDKKKLQTIIDNIKLDEDNFKYFMERKEHLGLRNVNAKLNIHFGIAHSLTIFSNVNKGTVVKIKIPICKENFYEYYYN